MKMAKNVIDNKSNVFESFKPFFVLLSLSGFNYRVLKVNKYLYIFYCLCLIGIVVSSSYFCCPDRIMKQLWALMEYISYIFILLVYHTKLFDFCKNLQSIDSCLRIKFDITYKIKRKICILTLFFWLFRVAFTSMYCVCYTCFTSISLYILSMITPFFLDVNRIWRYMLVDMVRYRLQYLRMRVDEMPSCTYYLHVSENKMFKDVKTKFLLDVYKKIADTAELMAPELHASMFASVICTVPKLIVNVYHILLVVEGHEPLMSIGFLILHSFQVCFYLFSPCIGVEQQIMEVEKIRLSLIHQFMETTDSKTKEELQVFLQYMQLRQFRNKIWRWLYLDITLPVEVINFCCSSIVIMLNFSHLLD